MFLSDRLFCGQRMLVHEKKVFKEIMAKFGEETTEDIFCEFV